MNPYPEKLKTALAQYEANCGLDPSESILDALWYDYSASSPVDDGRICASEAALDPVMRELSVEASDSLFDLISDLCLSYQRAAFLEGMRTGVHLLTELHLS